VEVIEALREYQPGPRPALFLGEGISGCPNWQREMIGLLAGLPLAILNPRRAHFPLHNPTQAAAQIDWELRHLRMADAILFWFPCESLCPIALYELGAWTVFWDEKGKRPLFLGAHPLYPRRTDVEIQTRLARPELVLRDSRAALGQDVRAWLGA
jgi:hypothetical protein